jgi:hypothetical protein
VAQFPLAFPFAQKGLHGVQIALLHAAHAGLWRQPARDPGRGKGRQRAKQQKRKQSRAKRCQGGAGGRFGGLAIIQIAQKAKPARRIGRRHTPACQHGPAFMGKNLFKAWNFSRGRDQRGKMPCTCGVFRRRLGSRAAKRADDPPNLGAQPVPPCGVQLRKTRHAAFGGEEGQALFSCADWGEKTRNLNAQGFTQQRR